MRASRLCTVPTRRQLPPLSWGVIIRANSTRTASSAIPPHHARRRHCRLQSVANHHLRKKQLQKQPAAAWPLSIISTRNNTTARPTTSFGTCSSWRALSSSCSEEPQHTDHYEEEEETRNTTSTHASSTDKDAWKKNLGRESEDWLLGPRADDWFTGLPPSQCPGLVKQQQQTNNPQQPQTQFVLTSLPLLSLDSHSLTYQSIREYFDNTWTLFELLFAGLHGERGFFQPPPHRLRHGQVFYYGHSAAQYVHTLRQAGLFTDTIHADYEQLFQMGVDEMRWDDLSLNDQLWPTIRQVWQFRKDVYDMVTQQVLPEYYSDERLHEYFHDNHDNAITPASPLWSLFLAMEHDRIHFETSSVLFRELPLEVVQEPSTHYWPPTAQTQRTSNHDSAPILTPQVGVDYPDNPLIHISHTTTVHLGKPSSTNTTFGWDNEFGQRKVTVPPFAASQFLVTNGQFHDFVHEGGYAQREFWCEAGWHWKEHRQATQPFFWRDTGNDDTENDDKPPHVTNGKRLRILFDEIPMPWDWPVNVNYYEAKAYARWKTQHDQTEARPYRLITEAEHHVLRQHGEAQQPNAPDDPVTQWSGQDFAAHANIQFAFSSHTAVDAYLPKSPSSSSSPPTFADVVGNAWEWTEDHFNPLDGFETHYHYEDFSTPCFDGAHHMIVGGSFMSTGDEASKYARFHFRPHFLQHSSFRLVQSDHEAPATYITDYQTDEEGRPVEWTVQSVGMKDTPNGDDVISAETTSDLTTDEQSTSTDNVYESTASLDMYLGLHYPYSGQGENIPPIIPHSNSPEHALFFPHRVAQLVTRLLSSSKDNDANPHPANFSRALDVGCAVGGASFELAKSFDHVDAFDFSHNFVNAAKQMQNNPELVNFNIPLEGDIHETVAAIHDPQVDARVRSKVTFFQGDACDMDRMQEEGVLQTYDGVLMSNLLCRLPNPRACLNSLPRLVNPGGVVVLVTPFTWLEEFTDRSEWLGGYYDDQNDSQAVWSKDGLEKIMSQNGFECIHDEDIPLLIREHARKYQYIVSRGTGWRKVR